MVHRAAPKRFDRRMILTQCPVCAVALPALTAKQCSHCKTRYCGPECQKQHWEQGHDKLCKQIRKGGGAEQYHADQKYKESVVLAVEECAEDTKGQTCYICTQALHWKTKEGLVRGCACRGTAGFAHVSCLAEQAKILYAEAKENHSDDTQWHRWHHCSLCEQHYHGVVKCALGWACWKTYVGRPEADAIRLSAMFLLGTGLADAKHYEDALSVDETKVALMRRLGASEYDILIAQGNLAGSYGTLGRLEEALRIQRDVYYGHVKLNGEGHLESLGAANNYATTLIRLNRYQEVKSVLRKTMPVARRVLTESHELTLRMGRLYARALFEDPSATLDHLREAVATLEEIERTARRVMGGAHPLTGGTERELRYAQTVLAAREGDDVSSVCDGVAAMTPWDA